jgi:Asp-tRNA(Asn)/Glu-tRNA(Gln) amidotransferase A subunit family amidase
LPFGLELSARPWADRALMSIAYAWEQATPPRQAPVLVENGLLPVVKARTAR